MFSRRNKTLIYISQAPRKTFTEISTDLPAKQEFIDPTGRMSLIQNKFSNQSLMKVKTLLASMQPQPTWQP